MIARDQQNPVRSWIRVNLRHPITEENEIHPDHNERDCDGVEGRFCQCGTGSLLREIRAIDGHFQGGKNTVSLLLLLGLGLVYRGWNTR